MMMDVMEPEGEAPDIAIAESTAVLDIDPAHIRAWKSAAACAAAAVCAAAAACVVPGASAAPAAASVAASLSVDGVCSPWSDDDTWKGVGGAE